MQGKKHGKFWSFTFYFLFFAGSVTVNNYFALYFQQQGVPGSQIGVLLGLASLGSMIAGPALSGLADASQRHRLILSVGLLGNLVAIFLFPFSNSFWWFLLLMAVQSFFGGPVTSLADNATLTVLGDEREQYGRLRSGGTIGWGIFAPIAALMVARYGMHYNFSAYAIGLSLALIASQQMHFHSRKAEGSFWGSLHQLLTNRKWMIFLFVVFIGGSGNAIISNYLFVYLQKIGTNPAWMGWAITISTAMEAPALILGSRLLRNFGTYRLLLLGLACMGIRCALYAAVSVPWEALAIQLLQFVTFPFMLVAGVSYADKHAPPGMGATAQSIFRSAFSGVGYVAGGFFGGVLLQYIGVQKMFLTFGAVIFIVAVMYGMMGREQVASQS
jgi:MFS transporter, PPP family, 3-phenylpropionic acid transporter